MKKILWAVVLSLAVAPVFADDNVDENALFSDEGSIVPSSQVRDEGILTNRPPVTVSFTGQLYNRTYYSMSRDFLSGGTNADLNAFSTAMAGNLLLDVRLRKSFRAYANFNFAYYPSLADTTDISFREMFVDFNIAQAVYFRLGKQVLQWGSNYFWNPTDLLNVSRKDFVNLDDYREGAMGLKMTVPFGTAVNLYGFVDAGSETDARNFGVAGKAEFVLGRTEIALSAWAKKDYFPVYGLDVTSRIWTFDVRAEGAFSKGDNRWQVQDDGTTNRTTSDWVPRVCLGFTKTFDFLNVSDRITLIGEFYYNGTGYDTNPLSDTNNLILLQKYLSTYRMHDFSKYYAALFTSISKFFLDDMTFSANAVGNLVDGSFMVTGGLSYSPIYNFTIGLTVIGMVGEDGEYTSKYGVFSVGYGASSTALAVQLNTSYSF